jgi:UDP-N-acetylglucosamine--N-acetylmuramyl-(pentapeptide) pyrophosphoryl-undecaprenol N-acetylglucosamine transferase
VYPALSIIPYLLQSTGPEGEPGSDPAAPREYPASGCRGHPLDEPPLLYIGNARGMERSVMNKMGESIQAHFFPMAPPSTARGLLLLALASLRCFVVLLRRRPQVTFGTGGYVCVPAALASWLLRVPLVLFLPDVVPGKAVAWLVPLARRIAVSTEAGAQRLPAGKAVVTGYPVRDAFRGVTRGTARKRFGLPGEVIVLGVFGGSQGTRTINEVVARLLPSLLSRCHVLHVCGRERVEEARAAAAALPDELRERYHLYPYLEGEDMAAAMAASDLAVCRSGASVLGELPAAGTPAVLVPFPVPAVHQRENAQYLAAHGAAVIVDDANLSTRLGPTVQELLADAERLREMAAACRSLARPDAAAAIADLIARTAA